MHTAPDATRVARRFLRRGTEFGESDEELEGLADFLATQVDSMDDESVAYAAYTGLYVPGARQHLIARLLPKLLLSYRKRLIEWFEHALLKRANLGGGGRHIQKIEDGLAAFAAAIPDLIASGRSFKLSDYLPDNEYLDPDMLGRVAQRVLRGVRDEAVQAGVLGRGRTASTLPFEVRQDQAGVWFIPSTPQTLDYKDRIKGYGFRWNPTRKRWETGRMNSRIQEDFQVERVPAETPPGEIRDRLREWFFGTWYPANADRLTRVFTDFARDKQTSYKLFFKVGPGGKPEVKFDRDINTAWEAVGELRYRYLGRQGREPWLEVLDRFIEMVGTTSTARLPMIFDRINNLQHSNGLFMEHFPSSVKSWYDGFLNAKFSAPKPDELAKFIPDRDLRKLFIDVTRTGYRPYGWAFQPPPAYDKMKKELANVGAQVNWREKGYPRFKGEKGVQPDRFDLKVQLGLDVLKKLHQQRERLLSTEPSTSTQYEQWVGEVVDWSKDYDQARARAERLLEAERQRRLEEPGAAEAWEAVNFPEDFLERFPWAVPGVSKSELAPFLARHASRPSALRVAASYLGRV